MSGDSIRTRAVRLTLANFSPAILRSKAFKTSGPDVCMAKELLAPSGFSSRSTL